MTKDYPRCGIRNGDFLFLDLDFLLCYTKNRRSNHSATYDSDLGLYCLKTRYYDSETGRFISPDNINVTTATPLGLTDKNLYAYCDNNPVMRVDQGGEFWIAVLIAATITTVTTLLVHDIIKKSNYATNSALDNDSTTTVNKKIESQATMSSYKYGLFGANYNGCEVIAVHNARVLKGLGSSFFETADAFHKNWAMFGISGVFGSNPYQIGRVLNYYGMDYTRVQANEMTKHGVYIVSYFNPNSLKIHTIAVEYNNNGYTTYNTNTNFNPLTLGRRYICGYYLG